MGRDQDYSGLMAALEKASQPFNARLMGLENKMDLLMQDRVTRTDMTLMRNELLASLVPFASYKPEHAALVEKDAQLAAQLTQYRTEAQSDIQRITAMIASLQTSIDSKFSQAQEATLSQKDRSWVRSTQIVAIISVVLSAIAIAASVFAGHIHFM